MSGMQVKIVYSYWRKGSLQFFYSLSCKIVNTRENSWNFHCFATSQMLVKTAKDNSQTSALLVTSWHETKSWLSLSWEPFHRLSMNIQYEFTMISWLAWPTWFTDSRALECTLECYRNHDAMFSKPVFHAQKHAGGAVKTWHVHSLNVNWFN